MGEVKELGALRRSNQLNLEDNLGDDEECTFRVRERERYAFSGVISFQVVQW